MLKIITPLECYSKEIEKNENLTLLVESINSFLLKDFEPSNPLNTVSISIKDKLTDSQFHIIKEFFKGYGWQLNASARKVVDGKYEITFNLRIL